MKLEEKSIKSSGSLFIAIFLCLLVLASFTPNLCNAQPNVMSFRHAISAINLGNWNTISVDTGTVNFDNIQNPFIRRNGISGFLVWLAPNGTLYQLDYPNQRILDEIGEVHGNFLTSSDGYTFWYIIYGEREYYWVDVSDGSIIHSVHCVKFFLFRLHALIAYVVFPTILLVTGILLALHIKKKSMKA